MNKRAKVQFWLEFFADLACLAAANAASYFLFTAVITKIPPFSAEEWTRYFGALFIAYVVIFAGFYSRIDIHKRNRKKELVSLLQNASLTYLLFSALILVIKSPIVQSRYMILGAYIFFLAFSAIGRYFLKRWITGYFTNSRVASIVGIITTSDVAEDFVKGMKEDWSMRVSGVALLDNYCEGGVFKYKSMAAAENNDTYGGVMTKQRVVFPDSICDVPVIASDDSFLEWIRSAPLDEVFINLNYQDSSEIQDIVEELEDMGITVHVNIPGLSEMLDESKFDNINCKIYSGYPMATFAATTYNTSLLAIKRTFDVVVATLGLIVSVPVIAAVAIPLKKESEGPLFFKQERVGKNGRIFKMYKLRSMYADAEERKSELLSQNEMDGYMFKLEDDPRITKVGKFIRKYSIDELPQFFNVIKGDMSLVGTRPPTVDEFHQYESRHKRRLSLRPGISGLWQVSGRSDVQNFEDVVELDCKYIDEWSILLDIKILLKTVVVVLTHKGAE